MEKLRRIERVYQAVIHNSHHVLFSPESPEKNIHILQVSSIAAQAQTSPNNTSTELCRLFRDGRLIRINSRPRLYCDLELTEQKLHRHLSAVEYESLAEFLREISEMPGHTEKRNRSDGKIRADAASGFEQLIGCRDSLREIISSAKAAVLYPPFGMHTLITGETGVGKSSFAGCMYDYGRNCGMLSSGARFVTFNCANYADNQQLLMAQLFGYCKGAYTGANQDHPGLVEYADGGVLFLDEIHRLHPEGQEKLFLLIDKGEFRRIGETADSRRARILLIGATTEAPQACMLDTFMRRIPVLLTLPRLRERTVKERLTLVLFFVWNESRKLRRRIHLDQDILSVLVHYDCPGNIGQLQSDIRLTLANVYFHYLMQQRERLQICLPDLSTGIQQGLFISRATSSILVSEQLADKFSDISVDGAQPFSAILQKYLVSESKEGT